MPIIIFSANRDAEGIAREAVADGYLTKPFDIDELLRLVATHASAADEHRAIVP